MTTSLYNVFASLKRLRVFLGPRVSYLCVTSFLLGFVQFITDLFLGIALTRFVGTLGVISNPQQGILHSAPIHALTFLVIAATIRGMSFGLQSYIQSAALIEFEAKFRKDIVIRSLQSRQSNISKTTSLFHDVLTNSSNFIFVSLLILSRLVIGLFIALYLLYLSHWITVVAFCIVALALLPYFLIDREIHVLSRKLFAHLDHASKILVNGLKNSLFLHVQNSFTPEIIKAHHELDQHRNVYLSQCKYSAGRGSLPVIIGTWIIACITAVNYFYPTLDHNQLVTYFYLFIRCIQMIGEIALQRTRLNLHLVRFKELWQWWHELPPASVVVSLQTYHEKFVHPFGWHIHHLSYQYPSATSPLFKGLDFDIHSGECCVITGTSGRGKSTLLNLMLGLETPQSGTVSVRCDNSLFPIQQIKEKLLNSIGYVGPENFLVSGTIQDNLLYGTGVTDVSSQEIENNLKLAHCHFVFDLPDGVHHRITEQGEGLSAGQKQRLMLARALLRQPKALFLDEATANLDAESEGLLLSTLQELKKSVTIIAVTHKPAFLKIADQHIDLNTLSLK